ncbi:MAG: DUF2505 domain-containing protein [Polyangiales bacterium]
MRYTIKHTIETDVDTYWSKLFFDAEFNRSMFVDHLGFTSYQVLEDRTDPDGTRHRKVEATPKIELPAAARKIFGDSFGYTEVGRFDPTARRYFIQVLPKVGGDKIKTTAEIWFEPVGDKRCERVVSIDTSVKVFGLGTLLEGFIEQQTRDSYARGADYTNRWIKEKGI